MTTEPKIQNHMKAIPAFTHHQLTISMLPEERRLQELRDLQQNLERIDASLKPVMRYEVALIQTTPDFLDLSPGMPAARTALLRMTERQSNRLRYVILTTKPENIKKIFKESAFRYGKSHLCIGLVVDDTDGLKAKVDQLRLLTCRYKLLTVRTPTPPPDLHAVLKYIDWLILCGKAQKGVWAEYHCFKPELGDRPIPR